MTYGAAAYRRVLRVGGVLTLVEVESNDTHSLDMRVLASAGQPSDEVVVECVERVLNRGAFNAFWAWIQHHPALQKVLDPVRGLSVPCAETTYDSLIFTILEQQISWIAAQRAQKLLCEWGGEGLVYGGVPYYAVPSPTRLAQATPDELKMLKITSRRSAMLIRIATDIASGALNLEALADLPPTERYARLMAINGVGHWTAVVTLTRAFGSYPAAATNDVALRAAVKRYLPPYADAADPVSAAFDDCGDYAGTAAMFLLWRYVLDTYDPSR